MCFHVGPRREGPQVHYGLLIPLSLFYVCLHADEKRLQCPTTSCRRHGDRAWHARSSVSGEGSRWNQILRLVRDGKIKRNDEPLVKVHDVRFMIKRDGKDQPAGLIAHLRWPSCPRCSCSIPTSPCRGTCAFSCLKQPPNFHVWIVKCRD